MPKFFEKPIVEHRRFKPECVDCGHLVNMGRDRAGCDAETCTFEQTYEAVE